MTKDTLDYTCVDAMKDPNSAFRITDMLRGLEGIIELTNQGLARLKAKTGDRVLEIGCGTGEDTRAIAKNVGSSGSIVAIDTSETMLKEAKNRSMSADSKIDFQVADVNNLEFPDRTFNCCWSQRVFQHLAEPTKALNEIARVLKPGGRVGILDTDWGTFAIDSQDKQLTQKITTCFAGLIQNGLVGRQLPRLCANSGFKNIDYFANTIISTNFEMLFDDFGMSEALAYLEHQQVCSKLELDSWKEELRKNHENNCFYFSVTMYGIVAERS